MSRAFPWNRLGIDATSDTAAIRKAYADALRAINVDEDIAGFAELRRARDEALWLAARSQQGEDEGDNFGLGDLDDDWDDDGDYDEDAWSDDSPATYHPDPLESRPAPELTQSQLRAQTAWQTLLGVLYPDGAQSDDAVTFAELDAGRTALDVLIARADEADLAEHDALDDALAELFARTWPRSAPFVEQANAAFRWLEEAGALEERPALMFLNQRLKGMRFHEKVQQPDHPLHKAWAELVRPGRAGVFDRLRVKRLEVHKLLEGVRTRYPELETYLDAERVASWDKGAVLEGNPGGFGPAVVRWVLIAVLVGAALARLGASLSGANDDQDTPAADAAAEALRVAQGDMAMADIFGAGTDMAAVRAADPALADELAPLAGLSGGNAGPAMTSFIRLKALASASAADAGNLAVRLDLKSLWMQAAQRQLDAVCRKVMTGNFVGLDLALTDKERDRERALLRQLLDAKLLGQEAKGGEYRYAIPGWLVGDTIKRSGLSDDTLTAALTDPEHPDRCKAEGALIEAIRASSQPVPEDVLKGV
ncbi:hypothetical protein FHS52_000891 [Erythromicrobium ramosum]|uniref:J domain-containing protein n=1 Tax=Erythrobacter ramosus TaxID=35811 RepID=A0A6I4UE23_9SPHN|nr:hypothetical protein [Erythrobacter ramosus]MBB3774948.1 hypothetical protein [Erythrobacter ramosus]MXP37411.1 hypothetical protein [Erythrobacter ramosus]